MSNDDTILVGDVFDEASLEDGVCGWIDLLGTTARGFSRREVEKLIDMACVVSSHGFTDDRGQYNAFANAQANVTLVGDALCISQKDPQKLEKVARDATALITLFISMNLFQLGWPHRGAIAKGSLECGSRNGVRFTSGTAVLNAIGLEKTLKTTGVVIADNLLAEAKTWTVPPSERPFKLLNAFSTFYLTSDDHEKAWRSFCDEKKSQHPYIYASLNILDQI